MARSRFTDYILSNKFHVYDASPQSGSVLNSFLGFSEVEVPKLEIEVKEIIRGNQGSKITLYKDHSFSNATLSRGTSLLASDFWDWIESFKNGAVLPKNLIVIQYTSIDGGLLAELLTLGLRSLAGSGGVQSGANLASVAVGNAVKEVGSEFIAKKFGGFTPNDFKQYIPAKGWMLEKCVPVSYDPAGTLDANGNEVSIQRLEIAVQNMVEFSTGVTL